MNEMFCEEYTQYFPSAIEISDFRWTYFANCLLNIFLTHTAIMLNIMTIYAIRKTSMLSKTMRTLLLSLAVSDVGVGLFVQPFYSSLQVNWVQQQSNPSCDTFTAFMIINITFSVASFLSVVAVGVDRFLAIHFHLRYRELVTQKRVVAVVLSNWLLSAFVSLIILWAPFSAQNLILSAGGIICFLVTAMIYINTYSVARRHKVQMRSLQVQQRERIDEMADFACQIKSAVSLFYVYLVFLLCFVPFYVSVASIKIHGSSIILKRFYLLSVTLVFLNSSLNPIIYCWKIRHIRRTIMDSLKSMSWNRN
ncbi:adenosine receptor A2b-like [Stylophora pistillata]|uniref:adenosine receptor A2b-like n=1 Tax=Stylophora pistillata TaxID=50429 RepID=UPI000C049A2F|nr:adenosine receptor A2b-like [Stylophora pistillata]